MGEDTIYYILGGLAAVYLFIAMKNKRKAKGRRNRKFMDDYKRKEDKK